MLLFTSHLSLSLSLVQPQKISRMRESQPPIMNKADLKFPFLVDRNQQNDHHYRLPAPRPDVQLMMMMASNDDEQMHHTNGIRDLLASEFSSSTRRIRRAEHGGVDGSEVPNINDSEESSQEQETKEEPPSTKSNHSSKK